MYAFNLDLRSEFEVF